MKWLRSLVRINFEELLNKQLFQELVGTSYALGSLEEVDNQLGFPESFWAEDLLECQQMLKK